MKKIIILSMMCLIALSVCMVISCTRDDDETDSSMESNSGVASDVMYVDLGLPSGTKWKISNEENVADAEYDFFSYNDAVSKFGNSLPTKYQFEELKNECQWTWNGSGYIVTGPNGNAIVLPAAGCRLCGASTSVYGVGSYGYYWSSTPNGSDNAWYLSFGSSSVRMIDYTRCNGRSVRLVQD